MSMLEYFQKHTNSFKHIFNLKIISNINTKIAPIQVKKSGKEPKIIKPKKDANINWVNHTG